MSSPTEITVPQLSRLIGLPSAPLLVDVRIDDDYAAFPRLLPGSVRRRHDTVRDWARGLDGRPVVVICQQGLKVSQGVAAMLRHAGLPAETLEGGIDAWREAGAPLLDASAIPPRDASGRTVWVTRARPKIDRIACPWLIRRFIDPDAMFLYVSPSEVEAVADRFDATPFDIEGVRFSHRGERCSFDAMLDDFGLDLPPLRHLAEIVRGADTNRPELSPQSPGLLAASLGLSRMFRDDLEQLVAGLTLYDAFYRWCRDATGETHDWERS